MQQLGGFALHLNWSEIQIGRGETLADTARILSKYVDGIVARVKIHQTLEELAKNSSVPVINGLSNLNHPVQILADLMTIWEKRGKLKGLKLAYVGDGNNICNSLLIGCSKVGVNLSIACPSGYEPNLEFLKKAKVNAENSGSIIHITRTPKLAVSEADIVYTDVFVSMGQETESEKRLRTFMPNYQVNSELLNSAKRKVIFMHPLPCHREEEVTAEVIDGSNSVVWDQAENRLHTTKSLLSKLL
ncbi:ornithine carbamoyltransferase [[Eubacterium] cellulosolvens]